MIRPFGLDRFGWRGRIFIALAPEVDSATDTDQVHDQERDPWQVVSHNAGDDVGCPGECAQDDKDVAKFCFLFVCHVLSMCWFLLLDYNSENQLHESFMA